MKKILLILLIPLLVGCAGSFKQASYVSGQSYIGMPLKEFQKLAGKKASIEVMESGYTVYRMNDYDLSSNAILDTKFFYFDSNDTLYKIDGGEFRRNRYRVEVIKR